MEAVKKVVADHESTLFVSQQLNVLLWFRNFDVPSTKLNL